MPEPPSEEEIERRMRPGVFSTLGFIGEKERLADVLRRDAATLSGLKLTANELAAGLDELIAAAESSRNHRAKIGALECEVEIYPGFQMCPWAADLHHSQCNAGLGVRHASVKWKVRNVRTGDEMDGSGLMVHLIRDHGFFQGLQSKYRVDPERLARLLDFRRGG